MCAYYLASTKTKSIYRGGEEWNYQVVGFRDGLPYLKQWMGDPSPMCSLKEKNHSGYEPLEWTYSYEASKLLACMDGLMEAKINFWCLSWIRY